MVERPPLSSSSVTTSATPIHSSKWRCTNVASGRAVWRAAPRPKPMPDTSRSTGNDLIALRFRLHPDGSGEARTERRPLHRFREWKQDLLAAIISTTAIVQMACRCVDSAHDPLFEVRNLHASAGPLRSARCRSHHRPGESCPLGREWVGKSTLPRAARQSRVRDDRGFDPFQGRRHHDVGTDVRGKSACSSPSNTRRNRRVSSSLPAASTLRAKGIDLSVLELRLSIMEWMQRLGMDRPSPIATSTRASRRREEAQRGAPARHPRAELAILDETDSVSTSMRCVSCQGCQRLHRDPLDGCPRDHALSRLLEEWCPTSCTS